MVKPGLSSTTTFNVLKYGAVGDGKINDSPVNQILIYLASCNINQNNVKLFLMKISNVY